MTPPDLSKPLSLDLPDEAATIAFAEALAHALTGGEVIYLNGDLGAGKSTLARALIRALTHEDEEVPSPTFTLIQTYDGHLAGGEPAEVAHLDLYRLKDPEEVYEIGLFDLPPTSVILIEWPEKLAHLGFDDRLEISLERNPDGGRTLKTTPVARSCNKGIS